MVINANQSIPAGLSVVSNRTFLFDDLEFTRFQFPNQLTEFHEGFPESATELPEILSGHILSLFSIAYRIPQSTRFPGRQIYHKSSRQTMSVSEESLYEQIGRFEMEVEWLNKAAELG